MTTQPLDGAVCRPRPRDGLASVLLDDELVVYDSESKTLHHLNAAATLVWLHCDGERTVDVIAETLADGSTTAPDAIRRDVAALVAQLGAASLLVIDA
jgi:Coenzyme PQQ synthesis protein D (PqqD)